MEGRHLPSLLPGGLVGGLVYKYGIVRLGGRGDGQVRLDTGHNLAQLDRVKAVFFSGRCAKEVQRAFSGDQYLKVLL